MDGLISKTNMKMKTRSRSVDAIAAYIGLFGATEIELQRGGSIDDGESLSFTITDDDFNDTSDLP
jgi:hypothetical protein